MVFNEKRKTTRVVKRLEVKYKTAEENTAITSNLSEGGLFIRTTRGVDSGSVLDIKVHMPNTQELYLKGRVVRNTKTIQGLGGEAESGMGLELINPPLDYINYVQSLLE